MKKVGILVAMALLLSGCSMSHDEYVARKTYCESRGMQAVARKTEVGVIIGVYCQTADGAIFSSGGGR